MYRTCLTCHGDLGRNGEVEAFPVGTRLAFDGLRGRLWAVCARCGRWNLSPLEERWEAIEQCERLFRRSPLGGSTDNISLARLPSGLELIRIGRARRPELAAWRYGRQLALLPSWRGEARPVAARMAGAALAPLARWVPRLRIHYDLRTWLRVHRQPQRVVDAVARPGGGRAIIRYRHLEGAELIRPERLKQWRLVLPHESGRIELTSDLGLRVAGRLLAALNGRGWSATLIDAAVARLQDAGDPDGYFARVASLALRTSWGRNPGAARNVPLLPGGISEMERLALHLTNRSFWAQGAIGSGPRLQLAALPLADRLALEMAAHEDTERRALQGELAELEAAWREAEEIAAIADGMFDQRHASRPARGARGWPQALPPGPAPA